jgi:uncharacterized membrane protein
MKVKHFLSALEHARVHAAIQDSEQGTSGDIVVYITHKRVTDPLTAAQREFRKLGLETAANKDGFLLFVAPASQKFAVVGGTALHDKTGQAWWDHLSALLTRHFKESRYTDGLIAAIEEAGQKLKHHFPAKNTDRAGQQDIVEE